MYIHEGAGHGHNAGSVIILMNSFAQLKIVFNDSFLCLSHLYSSFFCVFWFYVGWLL